MLRFARIVGKRGDGVDHAFFGIGRFAAFVDSGSIPRAIVFTPAHYAVLLHVTGEIHPVDVFGDPEFKIRLGPGQIGYGASGKQKQHCSQKT